eukprot:12906653-Prorocentrum_lima.AAC.1
MSASALEAAPLANFSSWWARPHKTRGSCCQWLHLTCSVKERCRRAARKSTKTMAQASCGRHPRPLPPARCLRCT